MKCIIVFCFRLQVAIATAAKAKLLLRELKTLKADLAFAKQRSSQLEEENKMLREALEKGDNPADDDMVFTYIHRCTNCFFLQHYLSFVSVNFSKNYKSSLY